MLSTHPFAESYIEEAASMFASSYAQQQVKNSLLPARFTAAPAVAEKLHAVLHDNAGVVLLDSGKLIAYMVGYGKIPAFKGSAAGGFIPVWGHAADPAVDVGETYTMLYTALSAEWVQRKHYTQAINYFNPNPALANVLFGLGFGLFVIDGIRSMEHIHVTRHSDLSITVATEKDINVIAQLDAKLAAHLRTAPTYLNTYSVNTEDIAQHFLQNDTRTLLAWRDGEAIAALRARLNAGDGCDLLDVDGSLGINFGYTDVVDRRSGVATQLLNEMLRWGREQGMVRCVVDFESANVQARSFWERHFQPICHAAIRRVDDRL